MDDFLKELSETDSGFFIRNQDEMKNDTQRLSFTQTLDVPCHNNFKAYMFYDVLQLLSRHAFKMQYYSDKIESITDVKAKIYAASKFDGITLNDSQCQTRANKIVTEAANVEIKVIIEGMASLNPKIELMEEVSAACQVIANSYMSTVDEWYQNLDNSYGVYSSKHIIVGNKI